MGYVLNQQVAVGFCGINFECTISISKTTEPIAGIGNGNDFEVFTIYTVGSTQYVGAQELHFLFVQLLHAGSEK